MTRITDFTLSLTAILILFPLLLPIIVLLRFTGEGKIFYKQQRVGKNGEFFNVLKFATMLENSPNMNTGTITIANDPRVLPVGKFLRKTKVNELPQLLNVLLGQMSIIGPRPLTSEIFSMYDSGSQSTICTVRPGLSGIGSIFFRSEDNFLSREPDSTNFYNQNIAPYKQALEVWYVTNVSYILYCKLIVYTVFAVLFPNSFRIHNYVDSLPPVPEALRSYCYDV